MEKKVLTWNQALRMGYQPGLYPFIATLVPIGKFEAVLDFKVWAKKAIGICCCFTQTRTGKKFQLTVYRRQSDKRYMLESGEIDFSTADIGCSYIVCAGINGKGRITFESASYQ